MSVFFCFLNFKKDKTIKNRYVLHQIPPLGFSNTSSKTP
ncbi:hypothetical protein JCM19274_1957 [Algibacter lectus]|uniref:Uncharacterized protein n=1 Tax=Algibacter lectus TaxID=221126 RepID=A0A090WVN2_9FLAO|nr:hypothetical protein JCM19274_1957 [Algibacter lectus]